jgi:hypothetical protein
VAVAKSEFMAALAGSHRISKQADDVVAAVLAQAMTDGEPINCRDSVRFRSMSATTR